MRAHAARTVPRGAARRGTARRVLLERERFAQAVEQRGRIERRAHQRRESAPAFERKRRTGELGAREQRRLDPVGGRGRDDRGRGHRAARFANPPRPSPRCRTRRASLRAAEPSTRAAAMAAPSRPQVPRVSQPRSRCSGAERAFDAHGNLGAGNDRVEHGRTGGVDASPTARAAQTPASPSVASSPTASAGRETPRATASSRRAAERVRAHACRRRRIAQRRSRRVPRARRRRRATSVSSTIARAGARTASRKAQPFAANAMRSAVGCGGGAHAVTAAINAPRSVAFGRSETAFGTRRCVRRAPDRSALRLSR